MVLENSNSFVSFKGDILMTKCKGVGNGLFQMMDNEGCIHRNRVDMQIDALSGGIS